MLVVPGLERVLVLVQVRVQVQVRVPSLGEEAVAMAVVVAAAEQEWALESALAVVLEVQSALELVACC